MFSCGILLFCAPPYEARFFHLGFRTRLGGDLLLAKTSLSVPREEAFQQPDRFQEAGSSLRFGAQLPEFAFEPRRVNDPIPRLQRLVPQARCEKFEYFLFLLLFWRAQSHALAPCSFTTSMVSSSCSRRSLVSRRRAT